MKRGRSLALVVAGQEIKRWNREKRTYYFLVSLSAILLVLFLLIISLHVLELTGFAGYIDSQGGYITEVTVYSSSPVYTWGGLYGLALRVPDFTQQLYEELASGEIERADVFFDCIQYNAEGGPEMYASTNPSLTISSATVSPGSVDEIDQWINCTGELWCANNTFTENTSIYIGSTEISGIPSTHTFQDSTDNKIFDIGVLNISGNLAFVVHLNETIQQGYNPDYLVNYQMLLPTPENTTQTYYFYADPNDECPAGGGVGNTINASLYGYVSDESGDPIENATVSLVGASALSNSSGFYNFSAIVLEGTYTVIGQKTGYLPYIGSVAINFSDYIIERNITLQLEEDLAPNITITPLVYGYVKDISSSAISGASIYLGNDSTTSESSGYYSFEPTVITGTQPIIAIKTNYDNYYYLLTFYPNTTTLNHNITMDLANLEDYPYQTGPYTREGEDDEAGDSYETARQAAELLGQDYWISPPEINKQVREGTFITDDLSIFNFKSGTMSIVFTISPEIEEILKLNKESLTISPTSFDSAEMTISGIKPIGVYEGKITISGNLDGEIPVKIEIVPRKFNIESLVMELEIADSKIAPGDILKYRLNLQNLLTEQGYQVVLKHLVVDAESSEVYVEEEEEVEILTSLTLLKNLQMPEDIPEGEYLLKVEAEYLGLFSGVTSPMYIARPIYMYSFFGIPLWIIFVILSILSFVTLNVFLYNRHLEKKKRYHLALRLDLLPKPGDRSIKLGKIAERKTLAYYNLDDLTTHAIVAGATGGGKSIAAQVFVEEMLMKNIAVIVFDPTAQWSGMLRKCDDKKMLSFYPKFKLKPSDARSFPGNVRQVTNELQSIDIKKYMNPGQIQIFTLNKLDPSQIDIFIAGVINNIFKSDPKEHPNLRTILVFDEVHRLLPKFGGSGKGFLQIERACREFRKWGFGVMLVSQVLSDFVGEIKANINTEVQMRVAEENDLERIKERYGLDALRSLVRADVGTGMIQNAEYNKGLPYFVNLRPILHNTRRLSDEILDKYNKYNEVIEDLEFQVEQLEKEKVDTFDLKMELKLVKDKLMTGNFTVVDIYLEGLKPRLQKQWESIGKAPKKREIQLINAKELESSLAKASKEREKWEKEQGGEEEKKKEEKKEDPGAKIVKPITFDNGIMISSFNELKDVLPNLDDSVFAIHVTTEKNDIANWIGENIDAAFGKKLKGITDKAEMVKTLEEFGKEPEKKEDEDKKEAEKKEGSEKEKSDKPKEEKQAESDKGSKTKQEEKPKKEPEQQQEKKEEPKEEKQPEPAKEEPKKPKEKTQAKQKEKKEEAE
ncbi:MAG: carboxypeptidase regulatory-like domain-containing protein [Nanoarchaeota archaeon]